MTSDANAVSLPSSKILLAIAGCFFALTFAVYGTSLTNEFVRWDDGLLISENPAIREMSPRSVAWVFSHYDPELYIPLTFVAYQLDFAIGGTNPFIYHFTSLFFHTLNALLVLLFIYLLNGRKWVALFTALLFALHPLHTEAVAWASALKDVLSGFFFLASLNTYLLHTKKLSATSYKLSARWYWSSVVLFLLGLLSKVSIIMLPLVLLLVDFYQEEKKWKENILNKVPYFFLSVFFGIVALYGKSESIGDTSLLDTVFMAFRSSFFYLQKLFVPIDFSVLYPAAPSISISSPEYLIPFIAISLSALLLIFFRKQKVLLFGALFFLLMILPSFQNFAKDGDYFFASDRYAYLGSIGILFLVVTFLEWARRRFTLPASSTKILVAAVLIIFAVMTYRQTKVWNDSKSLFAHTIALYPDHNARAYNNLGNIYRREEKTEEAIAMFQKAIAISPRPRSFSNLGAVYRKEGRIKDALDQYQKAIEIDPNDADPYFGLGLVYAQAGDLQKAMDSYRAAIDRDPLYAEAYSNMGAIYAAAGDMKQAIKMYQEAINADSLFVQAYFNLAVAFTKIGRTEEAIQAYESTIQINPEIIAARINLGILYYNQGRMADARKEFRTVLRLDPGNAAARQALNQIGPSSP